MACVALDANPRFEAVTTRAVKTCTMSRLCPWFYVSHNSTQHVHCFQAVMFADDTVVSKGMVKYASQITRESIVDIGGLLSCPEVAVEGCSQSNVSVRALSHRWEVRGLGVGSEGVRGWQ